MVTGNMEIFGEVSLHCIVLIINKVSILFIFDILHI